MPLHVIGLGVAEQALLDDAALRALQSADRVIGSERQLETVRWWLGNDQIIETLPKLSVLKKHLSTLLEISPDDLAAETASNDNLDNAMKVSGSPCSVALLASGDPLFYGIGKWVDRHFKALGTRQLHFYPAVSSIQVACHRLRWSLQDVRVVSLHGRSLDTLRGLLVDGDRIVALTDNDSSALHIARVLKEQGFGRSTITVCERLGYEHERVRQFSIDTLTQDQSCNLQIDPLNVVAIEVYSDINEPCYRPQFPGIPDTLFVTDREPGQGMFTKREVRLNILSLLQPTTGDVMWDVGAGCGGVAVELSCWAAGARVYAMESHPQRIDCLRANRLRFGVQANLSIIEGRAPVAFSECPQPNKVFVGGSGGEIDAILQQVWAVLPEDGVLVVSAVTESTRYALHDFANQLRASSAGGCETVEIAVSRGTELAGNISYRPQMPVRLFKFIKNSDQEG